MSRLRRHVVLGLSAVTVLALATATPAIAAQGAGGKPPRDLPKVPLMVGFGGAVSSVDRDASQVGIDVLAKGGNAADAAVATAAALGVTEPYSAGIGGGGFFVYYDAKTKKVSTIDGRETAPKSFTDRAFIDPATGLPYLFATAVTSGLSVGTPGTPALWEKAANTFGTQKFHQLMQPAALLALKGFTVDQTFYDQTAANAERFARFPATAEVFLPGGKPPAVGSTFRNPDLARTYIQLAARGTSWLYRGKLGDAIVDEAKHPTTKPGDTVMGGQLDQADLKAYRALIKAPITSQYKGFDVYGMPVPSSGGIAVAEILNLIEAYEAQTGQTLADQSSSRVPALVLGGLGDRLRRPQPLRRRRPRRAGVGADQRRVRRRAGLLFDPNHAQTRPIPFGSPDGSYTGCAAAGSPPGPALRGPVDDPPRHRGQVGQRGLLHPDHRADRRLRHHGARLRLPAQQRADRLQLHAAHRGRAGPEPARSGQAAALLDEPDHRPQGRHAVPHRRVARRRDDHHLGQRRPSSATSTATSTSSTPSRRPGCRRATGWRAPSRRS